MGAPELRPVLLFVLAISLSLGACGSAPETGTPPPAPPAAAANTEPTERACELLPRAEAEAVLGSPIEDVGDESNPAQMGAFTRSSCFYRASAGSVQLIVHAFPDSGAASARYEALRKRYSGNDAQDVEGLGKRGFGYREEVTVLAGRWHLTVKLLREGAGKITSYSDTEAMGRLRAEERPIAEKAIGRLPPA